MNIIEKLKNEKRLLVRVDDFDLISIVPVFCEYYSFIGMAAIIPLRDDIRVETSAYTTNEELPNGHVKATTRFLVSVVSITDEDELNTLVLCTNTEKIVEDKFMVLPFISESSEVIISNKLYEKYIKIKKGE